MWPVDNDFATRAGFREQNIFRSAKAFESGYPLKRVPEVPCVVGRDECERHYSTFENRGNAQANRGRRTDRFNGLSNREELQGCYRRIVFNYAERQVCAAYYLGTVETSPLEPLPQRGGNLHLVW